MFNKLRLALFRREISKLTDEEAHELVVILFKGIMSIFTIDNQEMQAVVNACTRKEVLEYKNTLLLLRKAIQSRVEYLARS